MHSGGGIIIHVSMQEHGKQQERHRLQHGSAATVWWTRCGALTSGLHGCCADWRRGSVCARASCSKAELSRAYLTAAFVVACSGAWLDHQSVGVKSGLILARSLSLITQHGAL
jgi:hypothetical protein